MRVVEEGVQTVAENKNWGRSCLWGALAAIRKAREPLMGMERSQRGAEKNMGGMGVPITC